METLLQDLRYAARSLAKTPGFTAVAVVTLALGIGANTAIFSVLDRLLLRPLPYPEPERLTMLYLTREGHAELGGSPNIPWSYPKLETFRRLDRAFERKAGFTNLDLTLTGVSNTTLPERLSGEIVSADYFPLLGVAAEHGRTFLPEEDAAPGAHPVVLLSHGLWRRRFGGDPGIVGHTIEVNRAPFTVVGVLPAGFHGLTGNAEAWVPMAMAPVLYYAEALDERWSHWFDVVARPRAGVPAASAAASMAAAGRAIDEAHPDSLAAGAKWSATSLPLAQARLEPEVRRSALVLAGAVGLVLLIACANLANLLLARAAGRQREVAVRLALGAGRARLMRQLLTESVLLALAGGAAGLGLAWAGIRALAVLRPAAQVGLGGSALLDLDAAGLDPRVLLFALGLSVVTGILFGEIPALQATRPDLTGALKQGAAGAVAGGSLRRFGTRDALVVAEVALALVLLVGAGLMLESFARLRGTAAGFEPRNLLTFRLDLPEPAYNRENAAPFKERLLARLSTLPGAVAASPDSAAPLGGGGHRTIVTRLGGRPPFPEGQAPEIGAHSVGPDHFRALGIPILAGRAFTPRDRTGAPLVAIVSRTAARELWPGKDPLGQRIAIGIGLFRDEEAMAEVVGVAGDVKYGRPEEPAGPAMYVSYLQYTAPSGLYFLRTAGDPAALAPAVRREVLALDPDLPVFDVKTMAERATESTSRARFGAFLLATLAALALVLAAVGIYGVMAYSVAQRRREMGLRLALGARPAHVLRLVVGQGAALAAAGIAAGLLAALALTRALAGLLYGVTATDPAIYGGIALLLGAVALAAAYLPARRAQCADPMVTLRAE